ncbi:uncharacterized protein LOC130737213 [Lotus japonicus]|uniref:uncharacterized protein LOC130737213 n=1 Tax=Lotus japonicus TaxID=34305 RepID=UPI00258E49ED|nr:uncharacterized protein LOC130737213 [Lotus japonicus]
MATVGQLAMDNEAPRTDQLRDGRRDRWRAPQLGTIKINVDVAVPAGSVMGYGYIARNSLGQVLATAASKWPMATSVALAEAMALRWDLQLSLELGFFNVEVELDSKLVVDSWRNHRQQASYLALVISDSVFISQSFYRFSIAHVLRASNMAADFLAKLALSSYCFVGIEEYSVGLETVLSSDLVSS